MSSPQHAHHPSPRPCHYPALVITCVPTPVSTVFTGAHSWGCAVSYLDKCVSGTCHHLSIPQGSLTALHFLWTPAEHSCLPEVPAHTELFTHPTDLRFPDTIRLESHSMYLSPGLFSPNAAHLCFRHAFSQLNCSYLLIG
jgi:hypothetical protein